MSFGPLQGPRIYVVDRFTVHRVYSTYRRVLVVVAEESVSITRENLRVDNSINAINLPVVRSLNYLLYKKKKKKRVGKSLKRSCKA